MMVLQHVSRQTNKGYFAADALLDQVVVHRRYNDRHRHRHGIRVDALVAEQQQPVSLRYGPVAVTQQVLQPLIHVIAGRHEAAEAMGLKTGAGRGEQGQFPWGKNGAFDLDRFSDGRLGA